MTFIVPCGVEVSKELDDLDEEEIAGDAEGQTEIQFAPIEEEARELRALFHFIFVSAVIRLVRGEDQIWLLESGMRRRLGNLSRNVTSRYEAGER